MDNMADKLFVVAGLGKTGMSCVRYLCAQGARVRVTDTRAEPPMLGALRQEFPHVEYHCGLVEAALDGAEAVVTSPGLDLRLPFFTAAKRLGLPLFGDIELFARAVTAPVVAITGSNGKSTVTTLLAEMARQCGRRVAVGGNLGTPALELIAEDIDLYVLELSSFQLELTSSLNPAAATVLNVSADHIDRHGTLEHYASLKARILGGTGACVINRDDPVVAEMAPADRTVLGFGLGAPGSDQDFGLLDSEGAQWLARGAERLLPVTDLRIKGLHNASNALAALALGMAMQLPMSCMIESLRNYGGLPHRCQWVAEKRGVNWYNDSKGTNVGATLAALLGMPGPIVLLAGGIAKGADFSPLRPVLADKGRALVLFGRDAGLIDQAVAGALPVHHAESLDRAVGRAAEVAEPGDTVLLSPACASFDMFANYEQRGERFIAAVQGLPS